MGRFIVFFLLKKDIKNSQNSYFLWKKRKRKIKYQICHSQADVGIDEIFF